MIRKASTSPPGEAAGASDRLSPRGVGSWPGRARLSSTPQHPDTEMASSSEMRSSLDRRVMPALAASKIGTLPLDTMYEILLPLPAKDLCRLRAVCRRWRALLSDKQFAAAHATRHPGPLLIAAYSDNEKNDSLVEIMDLSGHSLKKVPKKYGDWVVSVAKDLVHISNIGSINSRLLNPATGTMYCFPDMEGEGASYLFGQSASKGEHKVLRRFDNGKSTSDGHIHQRIEVLTLNNIHAFWRGKQAPPQRVASYKWTDVVIDGVAYLLSWYAFYELTFYRRVSRENMIITCDLETEEWGTILGPNISFISNTFRVLRGFGSPMPKRLTLADLNGSLAVVCLYGLVPRMDIWISTDIAKGDWVKQYSITFEQYDMLSYVHPVLVLDDQRLVLYIEDKELLQIYDPRRNTFTNVVELEHCFSISLYTGNLLSLEY